MNRETSTINDVPPTNKDIDRQRPGWVTEEMIDHTLETWQPYYVSPLTRDDALAIIKSVADLFEVLLRE